MKKMKKFLTLLAVGVLGVTSVVSAGAIDNVADTPQTGAYSSVELTMEEPVFKVTVPTSLPFSVAADGTVSVATDAKISNLSNGPIVVTGLAVNPIMDWTLVDVGTDFSKVKVDSRQYCMTLNGYEIPAEAGDYGTDRSWNPGWESINGNSDLALPYSGDFSVTTGAHITGPQMQISNVVFFVDWDREA